MSRKGWESQPEIRHLKFDTPEVMYGKLAKPYSTWYRKIVFFEFLKSFKCQFQAGTPDAVNLAFV